MFDALGIVDLSVGDLEGTDVLTGGSEDPDHVARLNGPNCPTERGDVARSSARLRPQPPFKRLAVHLSPGIMREPVDAAVVRHDKEILAVLRLAAGWYRWVRHPRPADVCHPPGVVLAARLVDDGEDWGPVRGRIEILEVAAGELVAAERVGIDARDVGFEYHGREIDQGLHASRVGRDTLAVTGRPQSPGHGRPRQRRHPSLPRRSRAHPGLGGHPPAAGRHVAERPAEERAGLVERALKIGLTALMDAGVTVNVDAVRAEFATLLRQTEDANARAATALDQLLRQNFADGDGRLPRTLEAFLGDRGKLRSLTDELFDETKRDSAIGRIKTLLGAYLEGDGSKLATLLDPTRLGSPLFQFRGEMTEGFSKLNERIAALEAASTARAQERAKGTAKGGDFEDLLEGLLADTARGAGDLLDRTSSEEGAVIKSKKGDFVLTVNPALTGGADLRIVVEAKDRAMSGRAMREEIREAKTNRDAVIGLVVFTPAHAPTGIAPFDLRAGDVYAVIDPECPDPAALEAAGSGHSGSMSA